MSEQMNPRYAVCIIKRNGKEVAKVPAAASNASDYIQNFAPCEVEYVQDAGYCDVYYMLHPERWRAIPSEGPTMSESKWSVGQQVYIECNGGYRPGEVIGITPTGRINVKHSDGTTAQFDSNGHRSTGSGWDGKSHNIDRTPFEIRSAWVKHWNQCKDAHRAILLATPQLRDFRRADKAELVKELDRLQILFDKAKAAVEAIGEPVVIP